MSKAPCDRCERDVPALRLQRFAWARICPECAEALHDPAPSPAGDAALHAALRRSIAREAPATQVARAFASALRGRAGIAPRSAGYAVALAIGLACGGLPARILEGALWADTLAWVFTSLLFLPFRGLVLAAELIVAGLALSLARALGGDTEAAATGTGAAAATAAGFFVVLLAHAVWIGARWNGAADDEG